MTDNPSTLFTPEQLKSQLAEWKVSNQKPLDVDELYLAFDMYELRTKYWVATRILAERQGEDTYPAQEAIDLLIRDIDYLFSEKRRLTLHGFCGTS